jgi:hypothetical protein
MSTDQTDQTDPANPFAPPGHSTSARNLLTVALQVFGFWLVCRAIIALPQVAAYAMYAFQSPSPSGTGPMLGISMMAVQLGAPLVVGIGVILLAGRISGRFYPASDRTADSITFGRVGAGDLYRIASFLLGVYMLIQAVGPGVSFFGTTMRGEPLAFETWAQGGVNNLITAAVYSLSGLVLIFGSRGIAQAMAAVPRDSDQVPLPQFSIRMLLILGVVFAVVLGVLRTVVLSIR